MELLSRHAAGGIGLLSQQPFWVSPGCVQKLAHLLYLQDAIEELQQKLSESRREEESTRTEANRVRTAAM